MNPILLAAATMGDKIDSIFKAFDLWVFGLFGAVQCDFLTVVAKLFTCFGDEMFVIPMAVLGSILCLFKKTRKCGASLLIAIAIGTLVTNLAVKPAFERIRPYNTLQGVGDYWKWYIGAGQLSESDFSFPSGHTTAAFEMATALFLCLKKDKKKIAWLFPILAVFVMCSRVYLMVHYASDVLAGLIVGTVSGIIAYLVASFIVNNIKFLEKIDAGKLFKKVNPKVGIALMLVFICGIYSYNAVNSLTEGGKDVLRCAYSEEYDCQNEAKVKDKYPAVDGKRYCKIHWKQLSGETE